MATVKKGLLTASPEWWTHLRKTKRPFRKGERRAVRTEIRRTATKPDVR